MTVNDFINKVKEILEVEDTELNLETNLKDLEGFDSIAVLSIIAMVDENFGKQIPAAQFATITTIRSLIEKIGWEYFE